MDAITHRFKKLLPLTLALPAATTQAAVDLAPYTAIPTGSRAEAVTTGDFNHDGRTDVALITSTYFDPLNDYKLKIYLQNTQGELLQAINHDLIAEYTKRPSSLTAGDFNNDGLADVAVGLDRGYILIFSQTPNGTLALTDTITTPHSTRITTGDLNADGLDDIAGIGWGYDQAAVFHQTSAAISQQPELHNAPHGGYDDLAAGDINGDGVDDLVVMSGQGFADNLAILTSNGQGGLNPVTFYDLGGNELTHGVTIGDLNSDGLNDVAVTFGGNRPYSKIAVFHQGPDGALTTPIIHNSHDSPESIVAVDMNHDGRDDLATLHGGWVTLGIYEQDEISTLLPEQLFSVPYASHYNPQGLAIGDINGDGIRDAVIADYNNGLVMLYGTIKAGPVAPFANAGPDQLAAQASLTTLNGSLSRDVDGTIDAYLWSQISGTPVQLNGASSSAVSFTTPLLPPGVADDLLFELRVIDNDGFEDRDTVTVTVAANAAPVADAGSDQTAKQDARVTLDATNSYDPDGTLQSYQWTQISGTPVALDDPTASAPSFWTPILPAGESATLGFELTVTDNLGIVSTDTVIITIAANSPPMAVAGNDQTVIQNGIALLDGSGSVDSDGTIASYRWIQIAGTPVELTGSNTPAAAFVAPKLRRLKTDYLTFELTVTDNLGASTTDSVAVTIAK